MIVGKGVIIPSTENGAPQNTLFFVNKAAFPLVGEVDKVYVSKDNGISWTWSATHEKYVDNQGRTGVYKALLSQETEVAPTAVVLLNTLGGEVVWTRDNVGRYRGTLVGAFPENKSLINLSYYITDSDALINLYYGSIDFVLVDSYYFTPTENTILQDGVIRDFITKIEVYP